MILIFFWQDSHKRETPTNGTSSAKTATTTATATVIGNRESCGDSLSVAEPRSRSQSSGDKPGENEYPNACDSGYISLPHTSDVSPEQGKGRAGASERDRISEDNVSERNKTSEYKGTNPSSREISQAVGQSEISERRKDVKNKGGESKNKSGDSKNKSKDSKSKSRDSSKQGEKTSSKQGSNSSGYLV